MKRNGERLGRTKGLLGYSSAGMLAAVTLLMVMSSASAAGVHPGVTLTAPYKGTVSSPNGYSSSSGCAAQKVLTPIKWAATTGMITGAVAGKANTCAKSLGGVGGFSSASASGAIDVAVPFKVASNGNHTIQASWSVSLATAQTLTYGACPAFNVHYPPALYTYQYAYCEAGSYVNFQLTAYVQDLNNNSWGSYNFSYVDSYNDTYFENYTDCYNYGTPSCYNTSGAHSSSGSYGYNDAGVLSMNGASSITLWSNSTNMVRSHHYLLIVDVSFYTDTYVESYNLLGHWTASAGTTLNAATLGNGAKLSSVTIV